MMVMCGGGRRLRIRSAHRSLLHGVQVTLLEIRNPGHGEIEIIRALPLYTRSWPVALR